MVVSPQRRSTLVEEAERDIAELLGDESFAMIQTPPQGDDPSAERRLRAEALVAVAEGRREPLENLRLGFIERLRRASDDFAATEGLRAVEVALSLAPRPEGVWGWTRREQHRRRWWKRKQSR
jgi:hypothetical protein